MAQGEPIDFADGQLSHLGKSYDMEAHGAALRILVIAMETGRTDRGVTLTARRQQILDSAALAPKDRNPHMIGVTHALRTLHGRPIGVDADGEELTFDNTDDPVHIFDAYAMANVRLCTSVKAGTTNSRPTMVMTKNCTRHLQKTIEILEPTICVVQSTNIPKALAPIVTYRRALTPHLAEVTIGGVRTLMAEFSHPTAWGNLNWGRWNNMPYLTDTVIPTLNTARAMLGLPTGSSASGFGAEPMYATAAPSSTAEPKHVIKHHRQQDHAISTTSGVGPTPSPYWDFWWQFRHRVAAEHPDWKARAGTSRTAPNATLPTGTAHTTLCSAFKPGPLRLELAFIHPDPCINLARLRALEAHKVRFESVLRQSAVWDEMPGRKDTRVYVVSPFVGIDDRHLWPAMMDWLIQQHYRFRQALHAVGGVQ
jgi:hypothetical protein